MSEGVRSHSKSCAGGEGFLRGAASSNLLHNKVLHARVVLVTMITDDVPYVPASERVQVEELDFGFYRVFVRYGFKDDPDIPAALALAEGQGLPFVLMESSFFLGRETLIPRAGSLLGRWREQIFILMFRKRPQCG
jgi:KUP system potassium uptake protein